MSMDLREGRIGIETHSQLVAWIPRARKLAEICFTKLSRHVVDFSHQLSVLRFNKQIRFIKLIAFIVSRADGPESSALSNHYQPNGDVGSKALLEASC